MAEDAGIVTAQLDALEESLRAVPVDRLWTLSDAESRAALRRLTALAGTFESVRLAAVRDLDSRPDAVPGVRPDRVAAAFMAGALKLAPGRAAADVEAAHAVEPDRGCLRGLGAALAAGQVSRQHVDVAVRAMRQVPSHLLAHVGDDGVSGAERIDAFLTEQSRTFTPGAVHRLAQRMLDHLDPDRTNRFDPAAYHRRELSAVIDSTGMMVLRGQIDPIGSAVVKAALDRYSAPNPTASADDADGQAVLVPDTRSRAQRQADGLVAICRAALAATGSQAPAPAAVLVHAETQIGPDGRLRMSGVGECAQTGPIAGQALARWTCDGVLKKVLTSASGRVLDVGRATRLATPAQRAALSVRDGGCTIAGCPVPAPACEAHHVVHWSDGGPTDLDNLALVCARHHDGVHAGIWDLTMIDGLPYATPPRWLDPRRQPLRNPIHAARRAADHLAEQLRLPIDPDPPEQAA